jgi:hypothetical protein
LYWISAQLEVSPFNKPMNIALFMELLIQGFIFYGFNIIVSPILIFAVYITLDIAHNLIFLLIMYNTSGIIALTYVNMH